MDVEKKQTSAMNIVIHHPVNMEHPPKRIQEKIKMKADTFFLINSCICFLAGISLFLSKLSTDRLFFQLADAIQTV